MRRHALRTVDQESSDALFSRHSSGCQEVPVPPVVRAEPAADRRPAASRTPPSRRSRCAGCARSSPAAWSPCQDLDLDIAEGEFVTLLGPSGSGKTTVLRLIAGFEQPTAGTVALRGRDVTGVAAVRPRRAHRVPGLRAVPAPVGAAQRRVPAAHRRGRPGRTPGAGARGAGHGAAGGDGRAGPDRAVRRAAAAGGAGPGAGRPAGGAAARRAARRAGPQAARADAGRAQADPAGVRASRSCWSPTTRTRR